MTAAVALFLAAIVAAANGLWYLSLPLFVIGCACAHDVRLRERRPTRPVTQLRRRQLDEYVDRSVRGRRHG